MMSDEDSESSQLGLTCRSEQAVIAHAFRGHTLLCMMSDEDSESSQLGLTCTFRASCYSTRLSWAHTPEQ